MNVEFNFSGEACGVTLGKRPSGFQLATTGAQNQNIHVFAPRESHSFLAGVYEAARKFPEASPKSDGRIVIAETNTARAIEIIEALEAGLKAPTLDGVSVGPYAVTARTDQWAYAVKAQPAGRASIKRLGYFDGVAKSWTVSYDHAQALADLLTKADQATVKTKTTTIKFPEIPHLSISTREGIVYLRPQERGAITDDEKAIIRSVRTLRWDRDAAAWVVSARYSRSLNKKLNEVAAMVADRRSAAAEMEAARAEASEAGIAKLSALVRDIKEPGALISTWSAKLAYCEQLNEILRSVGCRWDRHARHWKIDPVRADDFVAAWPQIAELHRAALQKKEAERAARKAAKEEPTAPISRAVSYHVRASLAPEIGSTIKRPNGWRVVIEHSKPWRVPYEESSVYGVSPSLEGDQAITLALREATPDEIAAAEAREAERRAEAEARAAETAAVAAVFDGDYAPELGAVPEGEELWRNSTSALHGYDRWIVETADGWLYAVSYDGSDGGAWGEYNGGYNTRLNRVATTPELVERIRKAATR